jgi:hypothetical protein
MGKKTAVPDAWDDDWEVQADNADEAAAAEEQVKISKAERLAKHAEINKQIWESAYVPLLVYYTIGWLLNASGRETPETFHFLAAQDTVPLKTEFKPALKVLSRKPAPKAITRRDPVTGLPQMTLEEDEDEGENPNKNRLTAEELRLKAQRDRGEKQRKYEEARARLFGTSDTGSGSSSPGQLTPPAQGDEGRNPRGRGRGRGVNRQESRRMDNQGGTRELFDPNYAPKPGSITIQKRDGDRTPPGRSTGREEDQVIRAPRGPDGSGRGGFGFAKRGAKGG